jgi:CrcB protein
MQLYLLIAAGGALGSVLRFYLSGVVASHWGDAFPWGTLLINISGSFVIGFISDLTGPGGRWLASTETRLFLMAGICGGYTTFSAFSLQTLALLKAGDWPRAGAYIVGSVVLCLLGVWLGYLLAARFNPS